MRIGHGYDVHRLVSGRPCIIGGVNLPFELGLEGHSAADVPPHAVMDSRLGALALGDIGGHFPDTGPRYKGADSIALLQGVGRVLARAGWSPCWGWQTTTHSPHPGEMPAPTPAPTAMPQPDAGWSRRQMAYGSAGLLTEPTVLVSGYLNDAAGGRVWTEDAKTETRQYLATAVQWLNEQGETYGRALQLYYDDGTVNSPLCRTYTPKSAIRGGRSSEESDALLTELDAVSATLDTAALQKTSGPDRVAFLYFLPVSGASFPMVHYADAGSNVYHEYSCLYRYDV